MLPVVRSSHCLSYNVHCHLNNSNRNQQRSGVGDLHKDHADYNKYRKTVSFVEEGLFTENSPQYTLTLYPNEEWYEVHSTSNPWIAAFGSVVIFVFTGVLFFLYDHLVLKEFRAKQELLAAKRHFMRFISVRASGSVRRVGVRRLSCCADAN